MRRSSLLTLTALGALICLLGGSGLFAALTDTAQSGTNSVDSAALAASADIQVARAFIPGVTPPNWGCNSFSEELGSAFFTAANVTPGYATADQPFCVRNVGSQPVTLSALATELVDVDTACTGDEAAFEDTCGGDKAGELSAVLRITYAVIGNCVDGSGGSGPQAMALADNATAPADLGALAVGQTRCYRVSLAYPTTTPADAVQRAQSDRSTWRITFAAQS